MASIWGKLDSGLSLVYSNFLDVRQRGAANVMPVPEVSAGRKLQVELRYRGNLDGARAAGLVVIHDAGNGRATGALRLDDLEAIAAVPEVLTINYGDESALDLDTSVKQVKADQLWTVGPAPNFVFSGHTGAGVLIAIIDTGIDIHHPMLWKQSIPTKATRVLRIWDLGLEKVGAETAPVPALLDPGSPGTYGVEYKEADINNAINGVAGLAIRHRDCSGHGTHVASIAAGDGRFRFKMIGVAPRADLIIVKYLHLQTQPEVGGVEVAHLQRFKDAITYCRNVADSMGRPLVINCSFGSSIGAHDGFNLQDDWLRDQFRDAVSAGKICVLAAGNDAGKRQHARIVFVAAATIDVPLELFDARAAFSDKVECVMKDFTKTLFVDLYYADGAATLTCELRPQGEAAFTAGPAHAGAPVTGVFSGRTFRMTHDDDVGEENGVAVTRRRFRLSVAPRPAPDRHLTGTYTLRITASAAMTVHVWTFDFKGHGFKLGPAPLPAQVTVEDRFQVSSTAAVRNVITVAAYDADDAALPVTAFSSRGPVPRHGVGAAPPAKPDIGAPGKNIEAAESRDSHPQLPGDTISMRGTSMSAPHVAGAVALMLSKNAALTPSNVLTILQTHALKAPPPVAVETGAGRLDAKGAFDNTP